MEKTSKIKGPLLLFITAFIWGCAFVAQSVSADKIEPFTFGGIRMLVGALSLLPVIVIKNVSSVSPDKRVIKKTVKGGIICGVVLFAASTLQQYGITLGTSAGKSGFITAMYVVIVPFFSIVFSKKKIPLRIWLCACGAAVGLYLLCLADFSAGTAGFFRSFDASPGDILTFLCAVAFSAHIITVGNYSIGTDGVILSAVQFLVAGILGIAAMFIFENPEIDIILEAKYGILYTGVLSSGVAYTLQIIGQKYTAPETASIILCLESVFAVLSDVVFLKTPMSPEEIVGCIIMFAAIIFSTVSPSSSKSKK